MKNLLSLSIAAGLLFATTAQAVTTTHVQTVKGGVTRTQGTSTGNFQQTTHSSKYVELLNGQGDSLTTYFSYEEGKNKGEHQSQTRFNGQERYTVTGNVVTGNATENSYTTGYNSNSKKGTFQNIEDGVVNSYSANGEVAEQRNFSNNEVGRFNNSSRTSYYERSSSRSHFAH